MDTAQKSKHLCLGEGGEELATDYLRDKGYIILENNWRVQHKELDIIAVDGNELVAVEVKTRTEPILDNPIMSINRKKQRNLISAAHAYVRIKQISLDVRFDVIWIRMDISGRASIEHIKDAFIPTL
ncbi:MAG: YraN family protein [Bacteroidales bacterium]|nr:YraN family protein [Bacteroidales bacterium]